MQDVGLRFYNPPMGRWVNRDPIGDEAFLRVDTSIASRSMQESACRQSLKPTYASLGNAATMSVDPIGLLLLNNGCECAPQNWIMLPCSVEGSSCPNGTCRTRQFEGEIGSIPFNYADCYCCEPVSQKWYRRGFLWDCEACLLEIQWCTGANGEKRYVKHGIITCQPRCPPGERCPRLSPFDDWYDTTIRR